MILIIDMNSRRDSLSRNEFVEPIKRIAEKTGKVKTVHFLDLGKKDLESADRVILSGTPLMDNEFRKHLKGFSWLTSFGKPVLGICAGMQVIAEIYGCGIVECPEIGMTKVKLVKESRLKKESFEAYELHDYSVKVDSGKMEVLAVSERCAQIAKHKEKEHYGIMFHPEVRNRDIIEKFVGIQ